MTRRDERDDTPSEQEVQQDFTVPGDADLRPAVDEGGEDIAAGSEAAGPEAAGPGAAGPEAARS